MLTVAAFDPGNSPSCAVYRGDGLFVLYQPMGVKRTIVRRRKDKDGVERDKAGITSSPDVPAILGVYQEWLPDVVVVETVGAMKGQGLASTASFMHAAGLLEGMAYGVGLNGITRLVKIRPQVWRGAWSLPEGKEQSRLVANRLFPGRAPEFRKADSHNVSDPLLMAMFMWHRETGTALPK